MSVRFAALGVLLCALLVVPVAGADGDPASDYLIQQNVFLPTSAPPASAVRTLNSAVAAVDATGDRVKVAVIGSPQDLGSVPSLFGQPAAYAKFLGLELSFVYKGPLLVVMPTGFGFSENTVAANVPAEVTGPTPADLTTSAATAVAALERAGELHYKDTMKPSASVTPEKGVAGKALSLRYQAFDDSGTVRIDLQVQTTADAPVAAFHEPFRVVREDSWYAVPWKIPGKDAHKTLVLCVQATDRAGNLSSKTCAKLTVS